MKTWYAVYTKQNCEKNVVFHLRRKKIRFFYPLNYVLFNGKFCSQPLFPSYIFVYLAEPDLAGISEINDIINLVYWKNQPVRFADQEMERIISFLQNHKIIEVEKIDIDTKPVQNEVYIIENTRFQNEDTGLNRDALAIPMLGVLLKSERIPAQSFQLRKNHPLNKFLFKIGFSSQ